MDKWVNQEIRSNPLFEVDAGTIEGEVGYYALWEHDTSRDKIEDIFRSQPGSIMSGRRLTTKGFYGVKVPWWPKSSLAVKQREDEPYYDIAWYPERQLGESKMHFSFDQGQFVQYPFGEIRLNVYSDDLDPLEEYYHLTSGLDNYEIEEDLRQVRKML